MKIIFYQMIEEKDKVGKDRNLYGTPLEIEGTLRDRCDIRKPVIDLETDLPDEYNFAKIPLFNRYYFVNNKEVIRTGLRRIYLSGDVLTSFADSIYFTNPDDILVERSSNASGIMEDGAVSFGPRRSNSYTKLFGDTNPFLNTEDIRIDYRYSIVLEVAANNAGIETSNYASHSDTGPQTISNPEDTGFGSTRFYILRASHVSTLMRALWQDDFLTDLKKAFANISEAIVSLRAYPTFFFPAEATTERFKGLASVHSVSVSPTPITIGKTVVEFSGNDRPLYVDKLKRYDLGVFQIPRTDSTAKFYDFSPYTNYSIYLPFVGIRKLPDELMSDGDYRLEMSLDIRSGTVTYYIVDTSHSATVNVLAKYTGTCGYSIPITSGESANRNREKFLSGISLATSAASFAIGAAPIGVASAAGAAKNLAGMVKTDPVSIHGGDTSNGSIMDPLGIFLIKESPSLACDLDNLRNTVGLIPSSTESEAIRYHLSTFHGFVKFSRFHIRPRGDGISSDFTPTLEELNELESLLQAGVHF